MADSSRRGLFIVLGLVAVAAAILAFVFLWWMPRQEQEEARSQIRTWEKRWDEARACLLGDPPVAADPADALAITALASGSVQAESRCNQGVGKLMRPPGPASRIDAVEKAWLAVEAAIPALGDAYLGWISPDFDERDRAVNELGVAISSLDAAQDDLRRAAGMSPVQRTGSATITRLDAPTKLVVNGLDVHGNAARVQAGAVHETQLGQGAATEVWFAGPEQGRVVAGGADALASIPDGSWMVTQALAATAAAPTDPAAPPVYHALAGIGAGAERALVLERLALQDGPLDQPIAIARSTDSGASWTLDPEVGVPYGRLGELRLDYVHGMIDLVVEVWPKLPPDALDPPKHEVRLLHLEATHPLDAPLTEPLDGFTGFADTCRRGPALWGSWNDQIHRIDGVVHTAVAAPSGAIRVIDCTGTAALVEEGGLPVVYHRCDTTHCEVALRGGAYSFGRAAMLDDGTAVYAASRGRLIALWTEGSAGPAYFRLPSPASLRALVSWGGVPHALVSEGEDDHLLSVALEP